ncbi:MAG: hypothetical protein H6739_39285 [Alphaproteobacteria bacterium]|nr:hypothetical protein [Alphaproteobacteria bacterium]
MSGLDALIERSRAPGEFVERRRFSLSKDKAIEKQREFALRHPYQYILELIQAAVHAGAGFIAIDVHYQHLLVAFIGGRAFSADELTNLFDYLFADRTDPRNRHLVQLAVGLNALLQRKPRRIRIESGVGAHAARMDVDASGTVTVGEPLEPLSGSYLLAELPVGLFTRFQDIKVFPEQALIEERCIHTPVPIIVNGSALFGYRTTRRVDVFQGHHRLQFDTDGRYGVLALPKVAGPSPGFKIVMGGTWITTLDLPELGIVQMPDGRGHRLRQHLFGVICDDGLRKTADGADIVRDRSFHEMLKALQPFARQLADRLEGAAHYEAPELPDGEEGDRSPLPRFIPLLRQGQGLPPEEIASLVDEPLFWVAPEERDSIATQADPSRFPYRVLELREAEARTLSDLHPALTLRRLTSTADVDFARRVMQRNLSHAELVLHPEGLPPNTTLRLRLHLSGPEPGWGRGEGSAALLSVGEVTTWCGRLPEGPPRVSALLELPSTRAREGAELRPRDTLRALLQELSWRLIEEVSQDVSARRGLAAHLLARYACPRFVRGAEGAIRLDVDLPPRWSQEACQALREAPLADAEDGPVTLSRLLALAGRDAHLRLLTRAGFERLLPLALRLGPGHLRPPDATPTLVLAPQGERWAAVPKPPAAGPWVALAPALATRPGVPSAALVGQGVTEDHPAWRELGDLLLDRLAGSPGEDLEVERQRELARLALLDLGYAAVPPHDGISLPAGGPLRVVAHGGLRAHPPDAVPLTADVLGRVQGSRAVSLCYGHDPATLRQLVGASPGAPGWLTVAPVRISGVRGQIGLPIPFERRPLLVVWDGAEASSVPEVERLMPVLGVLELVDGPLDSARMELLQVAGLGLFQELVEQLTEDAAGPRAEAAAKYGATFAATRHATTGGLGGTAAELARRIAIPDPEGGRWGFLERWLSTPEDQRPPSALPGPLRPPDPSAALTVRSPAERLTGRLTRALSALPSAPEVILHPTEGRGRVPLRARIEAGRVILYPDTTHPLAGRALRGEHAAGELLLMEAARLVAEQARRMDESVDLNAIWQALIAQRLSEG